MKWPRMQSNIIDRLGRVQDRKLSLCATLMRQYSMRGGERENIPNLLYIREYTKYSHIQTSVKPKFPHPE